MRDCVVLRWRREFKTRALARVMVATEPLVVDVLAELFSPSKGERGYPYPILEAK
jgi:hypothetical protein